MTSDQKNITSDKDDNDERVTSNKERFQAGVVFRDRRGWAVS
jgi:hypothetical protein